MEITTMNRSTIHLLILLLSVFTLPLESSAREQTKKLILEMEDTLIRSTANAPSTLHLKQNIKNRYPNLDLSAVELKRVTIIAKSRQGRGRVQLHVGRNTSPAKVIDGQKHQFNSGAKNTFHRVQFANPAAGSEGIWQLHFTGHFIVKRIAIVIEKQPGRAVTNLANSRWGTPAEGEKSCPASSNNAADGWEAPQNICSNRGVASYIHGYRPVRLYIRPDVSSLRQQNIHRVKEITISATALSRNRSHHAQETVSFGIDIGGKTHRRTFSLAPAGLRDGEEHVQTLRIQGSWKPVDIERSLVWIRPNQASGDFKVRSLQIQTR